MSHVRGELRRGSTVALSLDEHAVGPTEGSVAALAVVLRVRRRQRARVRARSCRLTGDENDPDVVNVAMSVSLAYPAAAGMDVFPQLRALIRETLTARTGLRAGPIDLEVVDVWGEI